MSETGTVEWIKALRERLGLSRRALAERLDVSWRTVEHWEQGNREPRGLYLRALRRLDAETQPPAAPNGTAPSEQGEPA